MLPPASVFSLTNGCGGELRFPVRSCEGRVVHDGPALAVFPGVSCVWFAACVTMPFNTQRQFGFVGYVKYHRKH